MTRAEPARTAVRCAPPPTSSAVAGLDVTVYGCGPVEAALFRALAPGLGVAPSITEAAPTEDTAHLALGSRCISIGHKTRITNATLDALRRAGVTYVSTRSIGCNHIDVAHAESVGIAVEGVSYSPDSVADYTLMLILMSLRNARSMVRRSDAHDFRLIGVPGKELRDLTVGVVGTGRIGAAVIDRLRGFGCRVLAHDTNPCTSADYVALDELIRRSDVITLHTPLTPETHHLLDRARISRMKPGAVVVNTGRGRLLDTAALLDALDSGRLAGAALDVVEGEEEIFYADCSAGPLRSELLSRLLALPNVLISPHTAFYTDHALRDAVENSLVNCLTFESRNRHG